MMYFISPLFLLYYSVSPKGGKSHTNKKCHTHRPYVLPLPKVLNIGEAERIEVKGVETLKVDCLDLV